MYLANDGNYREMRWFTPWTKINTVEEYPLPELLQVELNQNTVPFGDGVVRSPHVSFGTELCEELFTPLR
jgi:NAD+ synthase (glutamine-hydrolysing)